MASYLWAWFALFWITYLAKVPIGLAQKKAGFDNRHPRLQQEKMAGLAHRSLASHQNSFEALIGFTAAMSVALWANGPKDTIALWAWVFVGARLLYVPLYWFDMATVRSVAWFVGIFALLRLFLVTVI